MAVGWRSAGSPPAVSQRSAGGRSAVIAIMFGAGVGPPGAGGSSSRSETLSCNVDKALPCFHVDIATCACMIKIDIYGSGKAYTLVLTFLIQHLWI